MMGFRCAVGITAAVMAVSGFGQGIALTGTVTDKTTGQKLSGVRVSLSRAASADTTDSLGGWRLSGAAALNGVYRNISVTVAGTGTGASNSVGFWNGRAWFDAGGRETVVREAASAPMRPVPKTAAAVDTLRLHRSGWQDAAVPVEAYAANIDVALVPEAVGCDAPSLCWDFETGGIPNGWTAYRNEYTGTIGVDNSKPRKGAFSLHAKDLLGGKEGAQGGPKKSLKYTLPAAFGPVLWGRMWVYTTPARPNSHAGLFNARYPRPGSTATAVNTLDWYEVATYQQNYMAIWHPPEPPGFPEWVMQSDKPLVLDAWACLEWQFDAANGDAPEAADPRMWVDGRELAWPKTFVFSDPAGAPRPKQEKAKDFTFMEVGVYLYQGLPTATNWWIDDLGVGPRRIGCD